LLSPVLHPSSLCSSLLTTNPSRATVGWGQWEDLQDKRKTRYNLLVKGGLKRQQDDRAPPTQPMVRLVMTDGKEQTLLEMVSGTDRGLNATASERSAIAAAVRELEAMQPRLDPFKDPQLYRKCTVAYVGQESSDKSNAAGGKFRGRVGRAVFRVDELYQHILKDDARGVIAVNMILFRVFGLLPGCAILKGDVSRVSRQNKLRARAAFDPPVLAFGALERGTFLSFRVGPESTVELDTTFLGRQVRISRGASTGTAFVFQPTHPQDQMADLWEQVLARKAIGSRAASVALGICAVAVGMGAALGEHATGQRVVRAVLAITLLAASAKLAVSTGGIDTDCDEEISRGYGEEASARGGEAEQGALGEAVTGESDDAPIRTAGWASALGSRLGATRRRMVTRILEWRERLAQKDADRQGQPEG